MNKFAFSATANCFYAYAWKSDYEQSGAWPSDATDVEDTVYREFSGTPPSGKRLGSENSHPAWVDVPAPTPDELIAAANGRRSALIDEATGIIAPMKDALDGGYIEDSDKPKLTAWQKYRYALTKVDPAKPVWPEKPAE
ncbi:TPA: tail fiber assembly protein [Citrobacter freundii]|nr:tail fiber assembly protein [Citrobacter freundii]